jgi:acetoin utilization protein AcuB
MPEAGAQKVETVMMRKIVTAPREMTLGQAQGLMRSAHLRHLIVVQDGIVIGLVSHRAVLEASLATLRENLRGSGDILGTVTIEGLLRGDPKTIAPESSLEDAASRMLALRLGCLPVTTPCSQGPRLEGLVTEAGLLRAAYLPGPPRG